MCCIAAMLEMQVGRVILLVVCTDFGNRLCVLCVGRQCNWSVWNVQVESQKVCT